jgi:hypothetical protein
MARTVKTATTTKPAATEDAIYGEIRSAFDAWFAQDKRVDEISDTLQSARGTRDGSRRTILCGLAKLATDQNWDAAITATALTRLATLGNSDLSKKSISNFTLEAKRHLHPNARGKVADLYRYADQAYKSNKDDMEKCNARRDHFVSSQLLPLAIAEKPKHRLPDNAGDCIALAHNIVAGKSTTDGRYTKDAKRLAAIAKELADLNADYALPSLGQAVAALTNLDADTLKAKHTKGRLPVTVVTRGNGIVEHTPAPSEPAPIAGAVDIESLLAGMTREDMIAALVSRIK